MLTKSHLDKQIGYGELTLNDKSRLAARLSVAPAFCAHVALDQTKSSAAERFLHASVPKNPHFPLRERNLHSVLLN